MAAQDAWPFVAPDGKVTCPDCLEGGQIELVATMRVTWTLVPAMLESTGERGLLGYEECKPTDISPDEAMTEDRDEWRMIFCTACWAEWGPLHEIEFEKGDRRLPRMIRG